MIEAVCQLANHASNSGNPNEENQQGNENRAQNQKENELEYIHGEIYANIWQTDRIARISPRTGRVLGWIDLSGIIDKRDLESSDAVLNGIAYDSTGARLFVTGKLWPKLFEIRVAAHR